MPGAPVYGFGRRFSAASAVGVVLYDFPWSAADADVMPGGSTRAGVGTGGVIDDRAAGALPAPGLGARSSAEAPGAEPWPNGGHDIVQRIIIEDGDEA